MTAVAASEPVATCARCEVQVRFAEGYEPRDPGWTGGICTACRRRELQLEADTLSDREKREIVRAELGKDPDLTAQDLFARLGLDRRLIRDERSKAVRDGIATSAGVLSQRERARRKQVKKRRPKKSAEELAQEDLDILRRHPNISIERFAEFTGLRYTTAKSRLGKLVRRGLAEQIRKRGKGSPAVYRAV